MAACKASGRLILAESSGELSQGTSMPALLPGLIAFVSPDQDSELQRLGLQVGDGSVDQRFDLWPSDPSLKGVDPKQKRHEVTHGCAGQQLQIHRTSSQGHVYSLIARPTCLSNWSVCFLR